MKTKFNNFLTLKKPNKPTFVANTNMKQSEFENGNIENA